MNGGEKMKWVAFLLMVVLLLPGTVLSDSLTQWQKHIAKADPNLINLIAVETDETFLSLNRAANGFYALFFRSVSGDSPGRPTTQWVETLRKGRKLPLRAAYSANGGQYFLQQWSFDEICFCLRDDGSGGETRRYRFVKDQERWKFVPVKMII